jgi:hypothetical protein
MTIQAVWTQNEPPTRVDSLTIAWVTATILAFSLLLILNVKPSRRMRRE